MNTINIPSILLIIDYFFPVLVREINIKRTKTGNILTYGGNRAPRQAGGLLSPTIPKKKKALIREGSFECDIGYSDSG